MFAENDPGKLLHAGGVHPREPVGGYPVGDAHPRTTHHAVVIQYVLALLLGEHLEQCFATDFYAFHAVKAFQFTYTYCCCTSSSMSRPFDSNNFSFCIDLGDIPFIVDPKTGEGAAKEPLRIFRILT
jgi:hypothetical protein